MCSLLDDEAPGHDSDNVGVLNGGQAVGDNDAGSALSGFVQSLLHRLSRIKHTHTHTHMKLSSRNDTRWELSSVLRQWISPIRALSHSCIDHYH